MDWTKDLKFPPKGQCFFNFLASHDGIDMRGVEGILNDEQKQHIANTVVKRGGKINYKTNPDGSQSS